MPNFTENEIEIHNMHIRLTSMAGKHLAAFMSIGSVSEALAGREYFEAFCKVTEICSTLKALNVLEEDEKSKLEDLKSMLKVEAKGV
jgi:hypothetical protein